MPHLRPTITQPANLRRAFTLVELLVVIGVIALLIAMLLPSLAAARQAASRTSCAARLNQQIIAAHLHAYEHKGFYPLIGVLPGIQPQDLDDTYAVKYSYESYQFAGFTRMLAPITIALAVEMGERSGIDAQSNYAIGLAETDDRKFIKYFLCPTQVASVGELTQLPMLYMTVPQPNSGVPYCWYTESMSYVFNEAVLGWGGQDNFGRLKGNSTQIHQPSKTMFAADGFAGSVSYDFNRYEWVSRTPMATLYNIATVAPITLADAYAGNGSGIGNAGDNSNFDSIRHRGKINIAFFDGHVETKNITPADLATVYLLAP